MLLRHRLWERCLRCQLVQLFYRSPGGALDHQTNDLQPGYHQRWWTAPVLVFAFDHGVAGFFFTSA